MRARHQLLVDHAVDLALSAVEVYNKPDFKGREAVFSVLIVSAWEVLLKAKIVKDNQNKIQSIYVRESNGKKWRRNRSGECLTIGIDEALRSCFLPQAVTANLEELIKIRDAAIHLMCNSPALPYLVFALGSGTLQNLAKLARTWFGRSFSDYNFYILPLGFAYPFKTFSTVDLRKEPEDIASIIRSIAEMQETLHGDKSGFFFTCEIEIALTSAKKVTERTDFTATIGTDGTNTLFANRTVNLIDKYPYTFSQVWEEVRREIPSVKQTDLTAVIKNHDVKSNPNYAAYNFKSQKEKQRGPSSTTQVIYNYDFIQFALTQLSQIARP